MYTAKVYIYISEVYIDIFLNNYQLEVTMHPEIELTSDTSIIHGL